MLALILAACSGPAADSGSAIDADGDGHPPYELGGDDCDDADPDIYTGADERCDGRDEDCDLRVDEEPVDGSVIYRDGDGDGWGGEVLSGGEACEAGEGASTLGGDCDDGDPGVNPGEEELGFSGVDEDCDPATEDVCGQSAPALGALELESVDSYRFGDGVIAPALQIRTEFEDADGDLGTGALLRIWWGLLDIGGADTGANPSYELGGGTPSSGCGTSTWRSTLNLQVGGVLEADADYEIAVQITDKSGATSAIATGTAHTPTL